MIAAATQPEAMHAATAAARMIQGTAATMTFYTAPVFSKLTRGSEPARLPATAPAPAAAAGSSMMAADASSAVAPVDISSLPLVQNISDLEWQGSFRVPTGVFGSVGDCGNGDSCATFAYGGSPVAFRPGQNSLFVGGHDPGQLLAEVSVPTATKGPTVNDLPTAGLLQPFADPTEGLLETVNPNSPNPKKFGGLLVYQNKLYASGYDTYDGAGEQTHSHFVSGTNLGVLGDVTGPQRVKQLGDDCNPLNDSDCLRAGYFNGYFGLVPAEWQTALGGPVLTGQCCLSVIGRTSWGPAAFSFDPATLGPDPVTGELNDAFANPLVYYWSDGSAREDGLNFHALAEDVLRPANPEYFAGNDACHNTSTLFNCTSEVRGVIFPEGTRSVLFFGRQGLGEFCYGQGTSNQSLHGQETPTEPDVVYCYDPADQNKGTHAWPYAHYVWAYDANDLKNVRNSLTLPWEVKPYAVWQLNLPFDAPYGVTSGPDLDLQNRRIGGATYDPATGRMFLSQTFDDSRTPLIHVFKLALAPTSPTTCAPGTYSATGEVPCLDAPAGSYVSTAGATAPTLCAAGTYSSTAGAVTCTPAPAGSYVDTTGATVPSLCAVGSYSSTMGATACTPAPAGSFVSSVGASSATPCAAGTYSAVPGSIACTAAPAGSYVSTAGATSATPCAAGSYSAVSGATACTLAPAGSYVSPSGATSATPCSPGSYSATAGATACTLAPAGSFVSTSGATSATLCAAGRYSAVAGSIACTPAPAGSYVGTTGATSATLCAPGTYSPAAGATSCTLAPAGSYVATTGATSATSCAAGTYSSTAGSTSCTPCPAGTTSGSGATSCSATGGPTPIETLLALVNGVGPGASFSAKVQSAKASMAAGKNAAAAGQLQALINEVKAQSGKKVTAEQAAAIIAAAQQILVGL